MLKIQNATKKLYEEDSIRKNLNISVRETTKSSKVNVFKGLIRGVYNYGLGTYNIYDISTRIVFPEPNVFPKTSLVKPSPPTSYTYIEPFVSRQTLPYYWLDSCILKLNDPDISLERLLYTTQPVKEKRVGFILMSFKLEEDRTELFNIMDSKNIERNQYLCYLRFCLAIKLKSGQIKALEAKERGVLGNSNYVKSSSQITLTFDLSDIPESEEIAEFLDLRISYVPYALDFFSSLKNIKLPLNYKISHMMLNYVDSLSEHVSDSYSLLSCYDILYESDETSYRIACRDDYTILNDKDLHNFTNYWNPKLIVTNNDLVSESFSLHESLCSTENLRFGCCESSYCEFKYRGELDFTGCELTVNQEIFDKNDILVETIPLGVFYVTDTKKQYFGTQIQKDITAYDKTYILNNNVSDWYSMYMWKLDLVKTEKVSEIGNNKISYCRQVFSTYFNLAKYLGFENLTNYEFTKITPDEFISNSSYNDYIYEYFVPYNQKAKNWSDDIRSRALDFSNRMRVNVYTKDSNGNRVYKYDPYKPFLIESKTKYIRPLSQIKSFAPEYLEQIDPICRVKDGVGCCLVEEHLDNGKINRFLVDLFDMFLLSPEVEYFILHFSATIHKNLYYEGYPPSSNRTSVAVINPSLYQADRQVYLINGSRRLMYYNYDTRKLFSSDSNITGREVIQSLLEITGCFFKIDRYNNTQFKYCSRTSLAPALNLFPSENLFPRGADISIDYGSYEYIYCEDYVIEKYGKIQIVKNGLNSSNKSCVEWTYIGNERDLNTYVIDNNIFYCNSDMVYNPEIEDVKEMLAYMFDSIHTVTYTPMEVKLVGLPYIELGDMITIVTQNDAIESFLFKRNLTGIQSLHDIFESTGDNYVPAYNDFGFKQIND